MVTNNEKLGSNRRREKLRRFSMNDENNVKYESQIQYLFSYVNDFSEALFSL